MQTVFDILEWPQVLEHLESCCQTGYGRLRINPETIFLDDTVAIEAEMSRVEEVKRLIQRYGDITLQDPPDIVPTLERLSKQGVIQSPQKLGDLLNALQQLRNLARFFLHNRSKEETPSLLAELADLHLPNEVIDRLDLLVNPQGELLPSASPTYAHLKRQIQESRAQLKQSLQRSMGQPPLSKYVQEPVITERDGRFVLPIKIEHKADVPGTVHDMSTTGATVYIEPKSIIERNTRLLRMTRELEQEIRRILAAISEELALETAELMSFVNQSARLDVWMAKARQSLIFKANPVSLIEEPGHLSLRKARHPLLLLQPNPVVPNDVELSPPHRTVLITGPNTGGKTVLLKMVGLMALMARSGLHLPVAEGSALSIFDPVLADMGDPQSLVQNLSTFSGHMDRLKRFLKTPNLSRGLILIDEICAGTDPQEGAALATALLDAFYRHGATTLVTTHIGELKLMAHRHEGFVNASVEFDPESLRPTYRFIMGVPGSSHALNIALRLGIPEDIITLARESLSKPVTDSADLIESLETKNRKLGEELAEVTRLREEIQWEEEQLRKQLNRIEGEKQKTLQLFREGLKDKLRGIEQEVNELKEEMKAPRRKGRPADAQQVAGRFRKLQSRTGEVFTSESQKLYPHPNLRWEHISVGDIVRSRSLSLNGTIVEKHEARQEVTLQAGILKTVVPFSDLIEKVGAQAQPAKGKKAERKQSSGTVHLQPKSYSVECDVRGMTGEEAIGLLDKFLDDALVTGATTVSVIHGLGTGVLKKAIRAHLKNLSYVKNYGPAPAMEGGDGKTIISL